MFELARRVLVWAGLLGVSSVVFTSLITAIIFVRVAHYEVEPNEDYWRESYTVEVCENVRGDWVRELYADLAPVQEGPSYIVESPVCLCQMGMSPLYGHTEIVAVTLEEMNSIGPMAHDGEIVYGLMRPYTLVGFNEIRVSSCVYVPLESEFDDEEDVKLIYGHEIGHELGWRHAHLVIFGFRFPGYGHLMAEHFDYIGWNKRGIQ